MSTAAGTGPLPPRKAGPPRIAIVDDEAPARMRLRAVLEDVAAEFPHQIVGEANDGSAALVMLKGAVPDILLVDVQMPGMTGIELAREVMALAHPPAVIFVTAFDEFALEAFEVHALDYLLKPVRAQKLLASLQRVARMQASQQRITTTGPVHPAAAPGRDFISVHERGRVQLISVSEILYFKAELKYVTIRTAKRQYLTEESLVNLEEEFAHSFVRVHRNALIAKEAIVGCERVEAGSEEDGSSEPHWEVLLRGLSERLPVSRRQWPIVRGLLKR